MPTTLSSLARRAAILLAVLLLPARGEAQVRERPVPFDSAGRMMTMTPPLAARLGLDARVWPVSGDFVDARLYAVGEPAESYVIVVRRQRDAVDRYPLSVAQRADLAGAVATATLAMRASGTADTMPTIISEPVRGQFVANQTILGGLLFGPLAAGLVDDGAAAGATYLLVTGGSFFYAAALTQSTPVTRAQNHLAFHSALRGAVAGQLAVRALGGEHLDTKVYVGAMLAGGIIGDAVGFQLAKPMTDAEAHGTAHGSTVASTLVAGTLAAFDAPDRLAAASILAAGAAGYPLGLRYVRTANYRVSSGDVSAMFVSELLGVGAAAALAPDGCSDRPYGCRSDQVTFAMLTVGYGLGAIAGDRLLVRPFDHTDTDARLLALGTGAGALIGLAVPALAQSGNRRVLFGTATIGGILGAMLTENLIAPDRAVPGDRGERRTGALSPAARTGRFDVHMNPEALVLAGTGVRGRHSLLSIGF